MSSLQGKWARLMVGTQTETVIWFADENTTFFLSAHHKQKILISALQCLWARLTVGTQTKTRIPDEAFLCAKDVVEI